MPELSLDPNNPTARQYQARREYEDIVAGRSAGGTYYGRAPGGIVELKTGGIVGEGAKEPSEIIITPGILASEEAQTRNLSQLGYGGAVNFSEEIRRAEADYNQARSQLQQFTVTDAQLQPQIGAISSLWDSRISEMREVNKRREKSLETLGYRLGSRYSGGVRGGVFGGIISEEERQGLARVGEYEAQKQNAIVAAKQAAQNQNFKVFQVEFDSAEKIYNKKLETIKELNEIAVKEQQKRNKENVKVSKDSLIYDVYKSGITKEIDVLGILRDEGVTADDVENFFESVVPKPSKETVKNAYTFKQEDVGKLLAKGMIGEDIQVAQDLFNSHGLYSRIPELDNKSLAEFLPPEQFKEIKNILYPPPKPEKASKGLEGDSTSLSQAIRLARMVFGGGRALSDQDRDFAKTLYDKGTAEGKSIYNMADEVSGFIVKRNKPLAEGLRNVILNISGEKGMFDYDMEGLARLLNAGQDMAAIRKVENTALLEAKKIAGDVFISEADIKYVDDKVNEVTKLLGEGWVDEVGAFSGNFLGWISKKFGSGQAAKIRAKINSLTADLVNRRAGSALTETEWDRLVASNVPAMNDAGKTVRVKLRELQDDPLTRFNAIRRLVSLPELSLDNVRIPETRNRLYLPGAERELDDLLGSFDVSAGGSGAYNPSVWTTVQ